MFAYNQVATYLLSVIVGRVTGQGVAEVLRPRLLAPLGLPDIPWHRDPLGRELGFSGSHLTTEAIASIAQLYLDGGRWEGRQLLSPAWVAEATVGFGPRNEDPTTPPDWARGYGYSFWMQRHGYRGDGAYGQFLAVLPEQDLVVAITSEQPDMQATLDALWEHVVPAVGRSGSEQADAELAAVLASREIPAMAGGALGPDHAEFTRSSASDLSDDYTRRVGHPRGERARDRPGAPGGVAARARGLRRLGGVGPRRRRGNPARRQQRRLGRRGRLPRRGHRDRDAAPLPGRGPAARR